MHDYPTGLIIRPLQRTSPSTNEELRECFLRAAFQADQQFSDIRPISTYASLGSVSHQLLEVTSRGEFDCIREDVLEEAIRKRWMELVQSEVQFLQDRTIDSIPLPAKWPKYALRMVAACRAAFRIALKRKTECSKARNASVAGQIDVEVWYEGYGGRLAGRIDLIRHVSSGIELIDYKSGFVTERDEIGGTSQRIKEPYERQVLLYAALIHENEGQWPIIATVESLIDGPHTVHISTDAAERAVDEALQLLDTYNCQAAAGEILGIPNESNCRWCSFKALCRDFLKTADTSWAGYSTTVIGRVVTVHVDPPVFLTFEVIGGDHSKRLINIRGIPVQLITKISNLDGRLLSFGNLQRTPGADDLVFNWSSICWRWQHST